MGGLYTEQLFIRVRASLVNDITQTFWVCLASESVMKVFKTCFRVFRRLSESVRQQIRGILKLTWNRGCSMKDSVFESKLNELVREISSLPVPEREKLITLAQQTDSCHKALRKGVGRLQESLDYLRISVKYLVFDLEATKRENAHLRKLLSDKQ